MRHPWILLIALTLGCQLPLQSATSVTVINNRDYRPAMMTLIEQAESSIALAMHQTRFYEEYPGSDSNNLCDALVAAAARSVEVTFVIDMSADDWNSNNGPNGDFGRRLAEGGCAVYHDDLERITHTKMIVIDGIATCVSSVNWSHYALTSNSEVGVVVWGEETAREASEIIAEHAAAGTLQTEGRAMGEFTAATDDVAAYAAARGLDTLPCESATLLFNRDYYPAVRALIEGAEGRIDSVQMSASYYRTRPGHADPPAEGQVAIALTNALLDDLVAAVERGVETVLTLDGGRVQEEGGAVDNRNLDFGLRARSRGVTVWWDTPDTTTHAKMMLIDDTAVVGSTNWSLFAVEGQNNEVSVALRSPQIAEIYRAYIEALQAGGEMFTTEF